MPYLRFVKKLLTVTVNNNSPIQDHVHPDDYAQLYIIHYYTGRTFSRKFCICPYTMQLVFLHEERYHLLYNCSSLVR